MDGHRMTALPLDADRPATRRRLILAALATVPLTTGEITGAVRAVGLLVCPGEVYAELRRLERVGTVTGFRADMSRSILWAAA
jgi:hypothetical protein